MIAILFRQHLGLEKFYLDPLDLNVMFFCWYYHTTSHSTTTPHIPWIGQVGSLLLCYSMICTEALSFLILNGRGENRSPSLSPKYDDHEYGIHQRPLASEVQVQFIFGAFNYSRKNSKFIKWHFIMRHSSSWSNVGLCKECIKGVITFQRRLAWKFLKFSMLISVSFRVWWSSTDMGWNLKE